MRFAFVLLAACSAPRLQVSAERAPPSPALEVTSMTEMPASCASPPTLRWSRAPLTTRAFAVIASDRDQPRWAVSEIPARDNIFARHCGDYPHDGADPCIEVAPSTPPYETPWRCSPQMSFEVFALDQMIGRRGITAPELLDAIEGHVVARGTLAVTFD